MGGDIRQRMERLQRLQRLLMLNGNMETVRDMLDQ